MLRRTMLLIEEEEMNEDLMAKRLMNTMTEYSSDEVTFVINSGFSYQSNLESVSLPNCKHIYSNAFNGCSKLSRIYFPNLAILHSNNTFRNCSSITEFITNENFDSRLDASTFEGCSKLVKADFYHITNLGIGRYALACSNLTTLIIRNTDFVPPLNVNAFGASTTAMNTGEGRIYVPSSMVDAYKEATNWSKYADQILSIEEVLTQ